MLCIRVRERARLCVCVCVQNISKLLTVCMWITHTHTHTHTHREEEHIHTHTHARSRAHTHTHTHTLSLSFSLTHWASKTCWFRLMGKFADFVSSAADDSMKEACFGNSYIFGKSLPIPRNRQSVANYVESAKLLPITWNQQFRDFSTTYIYILYIVSKTIKYWKLAINVSHWKL